MDGIDGLYFMLPLDLGSIVFASLSIFNSSKVRRVFYFGANFDPEFDSAHWLM